MRTTQALLGLLASTGRRTDREIAIAGIAFIVGGGFLFLGQPLRRARRQLEGAEPGDDRGTGEPADAGSGSPFGP